MDLRVYDLGLLDGVVPAAPPSGGLLWDTEGRLHGLSAEGVAWSWALPARPRWSVAGRRAWVSLGETLACVDAATGQTVFQLALPGPAVDLFATDAGVDVLLAGSRLELDRYGRIRASVPVGVPCTQVVRVGTTIWLGGDAGVLRGSSGDAPARFYAGACRALLARPGGMEAIVAAGLLHEEGGLPLVWGFPSPDDAVLLPYGAEEWVICDRATGAGLRVVDARLRARWTWSDAPGPVRDVAVVGDCLVVDVVADEPLLGLLRPGATPLLLAQAAPIDGLAGDAAHLLVTHGRVSRLYHFVSGS